MKSVKLVLRGTDIHSCDKILLKQLELHFVIQQDVHLLGIIKEVEGTRHFFKDLVLCCTMSAFPFAQHLYLCCDLFAPCKGIQDSLGFWILCCGFRISGTGFQSLSVGLGFGIPVVSVIPHSLRCISDSKAQDSGFHKKNFPDSGIRIPVHGENLSSHKDK